MGLRSVGVETTRITYGPTGARDLVRGAVTDARSLHSFSKHGFFLFEAKKSSFVVQRSLVFEEEAALGGECGAESGSGA